MKKPLSMVFTLSGLFLLTGCPSDGGSGGVNITLGGTAPPVVYTANGGSNTISGFTIGTGGVLTPTLTPSFPTGGSTSEWVAVSPNGQFLYVSNQGSSNISSFTINSATGVLAVTSPATISAGGGSSP